MCHGLDGLELHTSMRYLRHGSVELELNPPFKILDPPLVPNPSPTSCWKHSHQEKMQREYKLLKEGDGTPRHCLTVGWNSLETTLDSLIALQWWQLPHAVLIMSLCFTMHTHTHTHTQYLPVPKASVNTGVELSFLTYQSHSSKPARGITDTKPFLFAIGTVTAIIIIIILSTEGGNLIRTIS